jgi:hypothetical protein
VNAATDPGKEMRPQISQITQMNAKDTGSLAITWLQGTCNVDPSGRLSQVLGKEMRPQISQMTQMNAKGAGRLATTSLQGTCSVDPIGSTCPRYQRILTDI